MIWITLAAACAAIWLIILALPWRPWSTRERLESDPQSGTSDTGGDCTLPEKVTVIIPARNEAGVLKKTLPAVLEQGRNVSVILVDDRSTDDTAHIADEWKSRNLRVLSGKPLPDGWTGKLWALEQALGQVRTELTLCLDADIALQPGIIRALVRKMIRDDLQLVSLMASLRMNSFWERFLIPAFVYFFKMLYPFRLCNSHRKYFAAAAGGCILIQTRVLRNIGGYAALRHSLIDDCALAGIVKRYGYRTWIGLTRSANSLRAYDSLSPIWNMVARTAFYQLRYSLGLLLLTTVVMVGIFWVPIAGLLFPGTAAKIISIAALVAMASTYLPVLKYYNLSPVWSLTLPAIAFLYICMTWTSAVRHWTGTGAIWKGRAYR